MRLIWFLVIFFIAYGSLYPFNFDFSRDPPQDLLAWLLNWEQRTIRSDVIANILLFIPYGFFGALTVQQKGKRFPLLSVFLMLLAGMIFALILQLLQFSLPSRVPHAADAIINSMGIVIGIALAGYTNSQRINRLIPQRLRFSPTPALLILILWLGWQFFPYIPVLDKKQFGEGISTIFNSLWDLKLWLQSIIVWLVFYFSWQRVTQRQYRAGFWVLVTVFVLVVKLAMFRSQLGWSEITAVPIAIWLQLKLTEKPKAIIIALGALGLLLWQNLYPWQWQASMNSFQWLPFKGFLQGSTWYNLSTLIRETLLLASVVYFFGRWFNNYHISSSLLLVTVVIITALQFFLVGKQPDITTPILALLVGVIVQRLSALGRS